MEWISILALLPALLLFGQGRQLMAISTLSLIPLWFFAPAIAAVLWAGACWYAARQR